MIPPNMEVDTFMARKGQNWFRIESRFLDHSTSSQTFVLLKKSAQTILQQIFINASSLMLKNNQLLLKHPPGIGVALN